MANNEIKSKTSIGSSSLILIFIILCLATFSLLSVSSAKSDLVLARKNAESVRGYYVADAQAEAFYQMVDTTVKEVYREYTDEEERNKQLKERLGDSFNQGVVTADIKMERGQALNVTFKVIDGQVPSLLVLSWRVYNQEDYEIDNKIPLWTG